MIMPSVKERAAAILAALDAEAEARGITRVEIIAEALDELITRARSVPHTEQSKDYTK